MGPTPGPWLFCPTNSGTFVKSERVSGYLAEVRHCRTTQDVKADAHLIAACDPDTIRALLDERDALAAEGEELPEQMRNLLKFVRTRGRVTTNEAAAHFARHRSPVHIQMAAMEVKGLLRRVDRDGALAWEATL